MLKQKQNYATSATAAAAAAAALATTTAAVTSVNKLFALHDYS